MKKNWRLTLIAAFGLTMITPVTQAVPMFGTIGTDGPASVVHDGALPGGTGEPGLWQYFEPDQAINTILAGDLLLLDGQQTFSLVRPGLAPDAESLSTITFLQMTMNLADDDGFLGGSVIYQMDGIDFGVFGFGNANYNDIFNTSSWESNVLTLNAWGSDPLNQLGLDLALRVVVPEPGIIALLLLGLAGMTLVIARRPQPLQVRG